MPIQNEAVQAGEIDAGNTNLHIDLETVISGQNLVAGTVVGRIAVSKKLTILAPAASDGSQNAAGVLWGPVNATAGDTKGLMVARLRELKAEKLTWPAGITAPQKAAAIDQLKALTILLR